MKTAALIKTCGSTLVAATILTTATMTPAWAGEFKVACPDRNISSLSAGDIRASLRENDDANPLTLMLMPAAEKYLFQSKKGVLEVNGKVAQLLQTGQKNSNFFKDF